MVKHRCWHGHCGAFSTANVEAPDRAIYERELLSGSLLYMSTLCGSKFWVVLKPLQSGRVSLPSSGCTVNSQELATGSIVLLVRAAFLCWSEGVPETVIFFLFFSQEGKVS